MISSVRASSVGRTAISSSFAVRRLTASQKLAGNSIRQVAGATTLKDFHREVRRAVVTPAKINTVTN
jgi:hypothetical protein